jgi:PAS domain S-box-containing protein
MSEVIEDIENRLHTDDELASDEEEPRRLHAPEEREIAAIIFDSISDGVFTVDQDCRITAFNKAAEAISGFRREEAVGQYCFDIFRSDICQSRCALRHTLANGKPVEDTRVTIITRDGRHVPISVRTTILRDKSGKQVGAVEFFRDLSAIENLRNQLDQAKQFGKLLSCNIKMQKIFAILPQIAESECNVLIQGPSGSGKELIAETIHKLSPRKENRYIRVNCAALPETLLESELFGYAKGAFTDARRDKPGLFLLAHGGTLLLDEIGEMPVSLQSKLLRVLNNGEFQPLGSTRTLRTDARILSATNSNLEEMIGAGRFREDLFYRINVINVQIPSLRERLEDIPILVDHFIQRLQAKRGKAIQGVSDEVLQRLRQYDFPGNIRELENAIEHAFVLCDGDTIQIEHLPERVREATENGSKRLPTDSEEAVVRSSLERNRWNKTKTARELGIDRTTLWRKLKKLGIREPTSH